MSAENKKNNNNETKTSVIVDQSQSRPALSTERASSVFKEVSQLVGGAEAIEVAQARIVELEKERDYLRTELDKSRIAAEEFEGRYNTAQAQLETLTKKHKEKVEILESEKTLLRERVSAKEKETTELKKQTQDLQWRFDNDLQKVRVKEREYENKNIIIKAEAQAVAQSKDEMILDLKTQVDQQKFEIQQFKNRIKENEKEYKIAQERQAQALKALRISMGILENDLEETKIKKVSGDD
ncbi:MAG: hypothetical protein IPM57_01585 [Oligoflexia bacterium]|nr:hypothetical protein [Oligoflexia bacterium]